MVFSGQTGRPYYRITGEQHKDSRVRPKGEIEFDSIQVYDRNQRIRVSVRNIESRQNKALSVHRSL